MSVTLETCGVVPRSGNQVSRRRNSSSLLTREDSVWRRASVNECRMLGLGMNIVTLVK